MTGRYELMLAGDRVVSWPGASGEDAAVRYADAHREASVIAWRADRSASVMALTRGCVIDGQRIT